MRREFLSPWYQTGKCGPAPRAASKPLRPLMQIRSALSGAEALAGPQAPRPAPGTPSPAPPSPPRARPSPATSPPTIPHPVPAASAPTSHEASWAPSFSTHTTQRPAESSCSVIVFPVSFPRWRLLWAPWSRAAPLPGSRRHSLHFPPGVLHLTYPLPSAPFPVLPHLQNLPPVTQPGNSSPLNVHPPTQELLEKENKMGRFR